MHSTITTPDGPFTIIADDRWVLASGWTADPKALGGLIHPRLRAGLQPTGAELVMRQAVEAVDAYYAGDVEAPSTVPVRQQSGPYRERAWETLRLVKPGNPVSYTEFAQRSGSPAAVRAAAGACARNAAALFVPCHRVLRADGTLGGFRYGPELKRRLLDRELR
ncbi:methylated-DNA--[protein]-cysteine S-methyltransferase [Nesterenkonia sphaerica]|uniref:Methylated-DNA--[protein]-cysteine S-methyltransferase n=1 Tax=Nesterenkonia sphaerica TaxID=1804988 RepID=A0A5R9AFV1_9MICC|nr:methylated-DNA--[protein]-cysteine S-methyltransferase [Nesterenkonia sphaerica]TLP77370.1 methylated-DNA--[protein]-cysteine S-methyltransferase [Nesterenkonia sphaerica]